MSIYCGKERENKMEKIYGEREKDNEFDKYRNNGIAQVMKTVLKLNIVTFGDTLDVHVC